MPITPLSPASPPPPADAKALRQAGEQFEAMMLERLLAAAHPAATGPDADWRAMADRQVAQSLAAQSPLGLADLLARTAR